MKILTIGILEKDYAEICKLPERSGKDIEISLSQTGEAGIEKFKEDNPDVVIIYADLDDVHCMEVARNISRHSRRTLIFLNSHSNSSDWVRTGVSVGVAGFFSTPLDVEDLFNTIKGHQEKMFGKSTI